MMLRSKQQLLGCFFLALIFGCPQAILGCPTNDNAVLNTLAGLLNGLTGWLLGGLLGCGGLGLLVPPGVTCSADNCVVGLILNSSTLNGAIPDAVGNLVNLLDLKVVNTNYTTIPATFAQLKKLVTLDLSNNKLVGGLANLAAANLSAVTSINLKNNKFTGNLPAFPPMPNLQTFDISGNGITGIIGGGAFFAKSTALSTVSFASNSISAIPYTLINTLAPILSLVNGILSLAGNLLCGLLLDLIQFVASLPFLFTLDLSNNFFCGLIPPLASRIISANRVILNNNCFNDPLPNWCKVYGNTCKTMKSASLCNSIRPCSCPPDNTGNTTRAAQTLTISNGLGVPEVVVTPINGSGTPSTSTLSLSVAKVSELDASGNIISSANNTQSLPGNFLSRYFVDDLDNAARSGFRYSTVLNNGAFFFWEIFVASKNFTKDFLNSDRDIGPNTVSQVMELSYWPGFSPSAVAFAIDMKIDLSAPIVKYNNNSIVNQSLVVQFDGRNSTTSTFTLEATNYLTAILTVVNLAYGNNNQSTNITHTLTYNSPTDGSTANLRATIPFTFYPSMYYDPDMGVAFGGSYDGGDGTSSGDGTIESNGDGDGFKNAYIAAIVVPVALLAVAVPVVVVTIVIILIIKKASIAAWIHGTAGSEGAVHL